MTDGGLMVLTETFGNLGKVSTMNASEKEGFLIFKSCKVLAVDSPIST